MDIVVRLKNENEIKNLISAGADIFMLDIEDLTTKALLPLDKESFKRIHQVIHDHDKQTYVWMNKMIHEPDLPLLDGWLSILKPLGIDGIVINDFSVYVAAINYGLDKKIIYQPGTMNTNHFDALFLEDKIKGMTLSKEITLDEIKAILDVNAQIEFSLLVHGFVDMFYSKRKLITHYLTHKGIRYKHIKNDHQYRLEEQTRQGSFYPILEDKIGTHIFRDKKLESFKEVKEIGHQLSTIFIERLFMDDDEYYESIDAYKHPEKVEAFLKTYGHNYHNGFYYTPTEKTKGEKHED